MAAMRRSIAAVSLAVAFTCSGLASAAQDEAKPFWLVKDGKPAASIVITPRPRYPRTTQKDKSKPVWVKHAIASTRYGHALHAAREMQRVIEAVTGAKLPIAHDGAKVEGNVVLIGHIGATRKAPLPAGTFDANYLVARVMGDVLVLRGRDRFAFDGKRVRGYSGSADSVYHFLERVLGVRWFAPGEVGRELPPASADLFVPGDLDLRFTPTVRFGGELGRVPYHRYNRAKPKGLFRVYGGHSWGDLVRPDIYFNKKGNPGQYHPEYYALVNGRRITDIKHGGSLCTTHPEVVRIATARVREYFDRGFDVVELGQPDSYDDESACHCARCMKVGDASAKGLGARIAAFHLAIAGETLKTHPHKYVLHSLYGPSYHMPKGYAGPFPKNFMLEFSGSRGEIFGLMKRYEPLKPAGVTIYLYEFTAYNSLGWGGPKSSVDQIIELFRNCRKAKVQFIYWCGWADNNFGMEAPQYWLAQQLQWDWNQDPRALMNEFWRRYFRTAGGEMRALHAYLDRRKHETVLARYPKAEGVPFKSYFPKLGSYKVYPALFNEETSREVARRLERARRLAAGDATLLRRIRLVEESYRFNVITAACYRPHEKFQESGQLGDLKRLKEKVAVREAFVAELRKREKAREFRDFCKPVTSPSRNWWDKKATSSGLYGHGPFSGPFKLDLDRMIEQIAKNPLKRHMAPRVAGMPTAAAWARVPALQLVETHAKSLAGFRTEVRVAWDARNLYVHFTCHDPKAGFLMVNHAKERDGRVWADDDVEVFIGHPKDPSKYYQFLVNAAGVRADLRRGWPRFDLDPDVMKANIKWDGKWSVDVDKAGAPKLWKARFTIPFATLGLAPEAGRTWRMNFARYRPKKSPEEPREGFLFSWNPTFGQFGTTGRFGMLTFGK